MTDPEISKLITAMAVTNTKLDALTKSTNELVTETRQQRIDHAREMKELEARVGQQIATKADSERVKKIEDLLRVPVMLIVVAVIGAWISLVVIKPASVTGQLQTQPPAASASR